VTTVVALSTIPVSTATLASTAAVSTALAAAAVSAVSFAHGELQIPEVAATSGFARSPDSTGKSVTSFIGCAELVEPWVWYERVPSDD
jgi:hypothetical protein